MKHIRITMKEILKRVEEYNTSSKKFTMEELKKYALHGGNMEQMAIDITEGRKEENDTNKM